MRDYAKQLNLRRIAGFWRDDQFRTLEEAFVWIAGHEAFHGLPQTHQSQGRNCETQANRFGFTWLDEWRARSATSKGRTK